MLSVVQKELETPYSGPSSDIQQLYLQVVPPQCVRSNIVEEFDSSVRFSESLLGSSPFPQPWVLCLGHSIATTSVDLLGPTALPSYTD
jgi:hypothetical protein